MNIQYIEEMYESLLKKQTITEVKLDLANLKINELTKEVEKYKEALKGMAKVNAVMNEQYKELQKVHDKEVEEAVYEVIKNTVVLNGMLERINKEVRNNE